MRARRGDHAAAERTEHKVPSRQACEAGCKAVLLGLTVLGILLGGRAPGGAATRFAVISHAPKPPSCSNGEVNEAPGAWIQNKSCGYWLGTAIGGGIFDSHEVLSNLYRYGRHGGASPYMCGWIPPHSLTSPSGVV